MSKFQLTNRKNSAGNRIPPFWEFLGWPSSYRSGWGGGPLVEAGLTCGDLGTYGSLLRRIRRSAETPDLLEKGLQIHLLVHRMKGRIRARDLVCDDACRVGPGSEDCIFDEAKGATAAHIA